MSELTSSQSTDPKIHFELAATLEKMGDKNAAIQSYLIAAANPGYQKNAFLRLAALYQQTGRANKAAEYMKKAQAAGTANTRFGSGFKALNQTP